MAFRRRIVRRRVPVYRRRRFVRRRTGFRRRRYRTFRRGNSGNYNLEAKYSYIQTVVPTQGASVQFSPKVSDFAEFVQLQNNYEAYRFKSFTVTIRPLFNVSGPESSLPVYVVAPYHVHLNNAVDINSAKSLNRSRTYHGARTAVRTFVPSVLSAVAYPDGSGTIDWTGVETKWRPRVELYKAGARVPHYTNIVVWDKVVQPKGMDTHALTNIQYEITCSAKITLYNQKVQALQ
uniref:Capsid protein n=1 Tax=Coleura bat circovirus TaxID=3141865 RepID=A0AAU7E2P2_9CIRC